MIYDHPRGRDRSLVATGTGERFWTPKRLLAILALLLLAALALFYLWQSWQWIYWLNELHKAQARLERLQTERDRLTLEVARAFSLKRLEEIATQRLGMIHPKPKYLHIPPREP